jgi:hypothetical protein
MMNEVTIADELKARYPEAAAMFMAVSNRVELNALKRQLTKDQTFPDGVIHFLWEARKEELIVNESAYVNRPASEARLDRINHITDSSGKKTARKMHR